MKTVFEIFKILLLALIALLLGIDVGLVDQTSWAPVKSWLERAGIIAEQSSDDGSLHSGIATPADTEDTATRGGAAALTVSLEEVPEPADIVQAHPSAGGDEGEAQAAASDGVQNIELAGQAPVDVTGNDRVEGAGPWARVEMGSEHELKTLLKHRLSRRYEFPEHVRFRETQFVLRRLFNDAGLEIAADREIEFAIFCGEYSVPNAAALYGVYRPFYAEVLVSHADRSIDGEYWLDIEGDIKKSISFRSDLLISARQETFDRLYSQHCGSKKGFLVGDYRDYAVGQLAPFYRRHFNEIADKAAQSDYAHSLMECVQSKATLQECYRELPATGDGK